MLLSDFGPVVKTDLPPPPPIVDVAANDAISVLMHRYDVRSRGSLTSETARLIRGRISSLSPPPLAPLTRGEYELRDRGDFNSSRCYDIEGAEVKERRALDGRWAKERKEMADVPRNGSR